MKKTTFHEFDPAIYPVKLWISITNDLGAIKEKFKLYPSQQEISINFSQKDALAGLVYHIENKKIGVLIVFESKKCCTIENITHECYHAVDEIWKHLSEEYWGSEATAYLIGWMADCCWKVKTRK